MTTSTRPSASRVASSLFNSGPNDSLAAVDVYTDKPNGVINSLVGKLSSFQSNSLDSNRGLSDVSSQLTSLFSGRQGRFSVDSDDMLNRVTSLVGGGRGGLSSLTSTVLSSLSRGTGLNSATAGQLALTIGGVESRVNAKDPSAVADFMAVVNLLACDHAMGTILDVGAETSLLTGIIQNCIAMGLAGMIAGVICGARNPTALRAALGNSVEGALAAGSLVAINAILDENNGRSIVMGRAPDAPRRLLTNYQLPSGTRPSDYPARASELTTTLNRMDPNWAGYSRGGSNIGNLSTYSGASPDALKVLATDPVHRVPATIVNDFSTVTSMKGAARAMYPAMQLA